MGGLNRFDRWARAVSGASGSWQAFTVALTSILIWFAGGFFVGFSNELYQLAVNTGTTIVTFLMVFLIQNAQNRDTSAINLKLDELVRVTAARNEMIRIEDRGQDEIKREKEGILP